MRILYITTSLGMGGAERIVCDLADSMFDKGYRVGIVCLTGDILVMPKNAEIEIYKLNTNSLMSFIFCIIQIYKIIKKNDYKIVHAHLFHAIIFARLLKLFKKIKIISHAHSKSYGGYFRKIIYCLTDRWSDLNVNVSQEATDNFIKNKVFRNSNALTVVNGIDTKIFFNDSNKRLDLRNKFDLESDQNIIINVARFTEAKDHINLINAFNYALKNGMKNSHLYLVGDGPLKNQVENEINKLELRNFITLLGIRSDISDLLNMSDIFVLSSAWEGLPLVIAEAMACERLVLSTDCGGVKEVLNNDRYLVEIKNSDVLGQKILEVASYSQEEKKKIGEVNRSIVLKKYSLDKMSEDWDKIYQSF